MTAEPKWLDVPEDHDYVAAADYLSLHMPADTARDIADALRTTTTITRKAKDILRASDLPLLPIDNKHVRKDLHKDVLSPVLLVVTGGRLLIADGYHRVCAGCHLSEDADIHARILWT